MKIAVVDDDKAICEAIAQLIKNQESEAEVCQFSSGKEMLETGENFAISFLDIAMEEMSGLELAGKLRHEQERKGWVKSILIFITGYREYMEEAFDVNAFHYLVKPIDEEKFSPEFRHTLVGFVAGAHIDGFHYGQQNGEPQRQRHKNKMEENGHGKLQP